MSGTTENKKWGWQPIALIVLSALVGCLIFIVIQMKVQPSVSDDNEKIRKLDEKISQLESDYDKIEKENLQLKEQIASQEMINKRLDKNILKINGWIKEQSNTVGSLNNTDGFKLFSDWLSEDF